MNHAVLAVLHPEQVEVETWRSDELEVRRGLSSELDEMWSFVQAKAHPRWLWHAMDHHTGKVLAYVFGRRKDSVFLRLQELLEPFGITKYYTDGWGAYERHIDAEQHHVGVTVQVVTTGITPQFATSERLREAETEPRHHVGPHHTPR